MMMKLETLQAKIQKILTDNPDTRGNDKLLYFRLAQELSPNTLNMAFGSFLMDRHVNVPSFESVSRARRKIQSKFPELRADKRVTELRAEKEREYREYAHG